MNAAPSKSLDIGLWIAQALLALTFVGTGVWKLLTPVANLAALIPYAGQVPEAFLHLTGVIDLLGGLGILLPSLTRIKPGLTVLAARAGTTTTQTSALSAVRPNLPTTSATQS
jgi:uncharacterized membrane protein YphA (DoxX/SURF4 family)